MNRFENEENLVSVSAEELVANSDPIKIRTNDDLTAKLSTTELFLVLHSVGDSLTRSEVRQLVREYLLTQERQFRYASGVLEMDQNEYVQLVDAFLEDLLRYPITDELKERFANVVIREMQSDLKRRFIRRMAEARDAGILTSEHPWEAEQLLFGLGDRQLFTPPVKEPTLLATVLVLAFTGWLSVVAAQTADNPGPMLRPEGREKAVLISDAKTEKAIEQKKEVDIDKLIISIDSDNPKDRVNALEWLALLGQKAEPALPKLNEHLRSQDPKKRCEGAWAIGYISHGDKKDVQALITALKDEDGRVRRVAALALGRIGTSAKAALPILNSMHETTDDVFFVAERCISGNSPSACSRVKVLLQRESPSLRLLLEERMELKPRVLEGFCMCSLA